MKRLKTVFILIFILCSSVRFLGQVKKPLDHSVYDGWKQIGNVDVSDKGNVVTYEVLPQEGDGRLELYKVRNKQKVTINRGYSATITPDESFVVCLIKPFFADTRKAKIKKVKEDQMPKDSLAVISLRDGKVLKFPNVVSYQMPQRSSGLIAFLTADTSLIAKADRKKTKIGKPLLICYLGKSLMDTIRYVDQYGFDNDGKSIAIVIKDSTKKLSAGIYTPLVHKFTTVVRDKSFLTLPQFNDTGDKVLYLTSADTVSSGTKRCDLNQFSFGAAVSQLLVDKDYSKNLPENWLLNENSKPFYSKDGKHIFVGVAPVQQPKDTTLVPFETASLDLWNYADQQLPPSQLKNLKNDLKRTCLAVYDSEKKELVPLTTSFFDSVKSLNEANASQFLSVDETKTIIEQQWVEQTSSDLSLVSLADGQRLSIASGPFSTITPSPDGKFIVWFNLKDSQWYLYDIANTKIRCLTASLKVSFADEDNDVPQYPEPYGLAGWSKDDKYVLLYDRFDIWQFSTKGNAVVNLTGAHGRAENRVFRYLNTKKQKEKNEMIREKLFIGAGETMLLSVFDKTTKQQGFATMEFHENKTLAPKVRLFGNFSLPLVAKAKDMDRYAYIKANFQTSPDVYTNTGAWNQEDKLSDINPQMKDYLWGTAELMKWKAYDGTQLEGLLYKPENFDATRKYPVIIYFYERNSDKLYSYYNPVPSRSTINIPFYCSRGYVVFVPDIVYKVGFPGESAYNCIVSGAEALASNPWIDKSNMAIQGQSWGGYQVAYLITRTNMFKAAGAGAPVANMTSAYGGIRWGTGKSRQFQYEHTQSRIGKTLWEAPDLYIANSPLFAADKVETPLLITHNDADGAVPWYQGIEYFMALRRLGKKVWMIQYNDEDHNLTERRNMKDLSVRLQQFFDHYLKGDPMPAWMKTGIPASRKGQYFGFENADSFYTK